MTSTPAPTGYFNQTYTVEYSVPGDLDGTTLIPEQIRVPFDTGDPQQFYRPEVTGNAGLIDVDYLVQANDPEARRGARGYRVVNQVWLVSPVAGELGASLDVVDALSGTVVVQENIADLGGLTQFFRNRPFLVPQGSLLRIGGFSNPGPGNIKLRLTISFMENLISAQQAVCRCTTS